MKIVVRAPAKINLYLDIIGLRDDGYHELSMVMQTVNLYDRVLIEKLTKSGITLTCPSGITEDITKNSAYKAATAFFERVGLTDVGVHIDITKVIPMQAGLAGGSTDAAAVISGLNKLYDTGLSQAQLVEIGEKVGADVPFCVLGGTMHATGIGTKLSPLSQIPDCYILIVKPPVSVRTEEAYALADSVRVGTKHGINPVTSALENEDLLGLSKALYNRFESVMDLPEVARIKSLMCAEGALGACMTGSGSAVFGLFDDLETMKICSEKLAILGEVYGCMPCRGQEIFQ